MYGKVKQFLTATKKKKINEEQTFYDCSQALQFTKFPHLLQS